VQDPSPLVWLFDIDGTLLLTQGAGRDALSLALRDEFGIHDDLASVPFAGRTDHLILGDVCARHGVGFANGGEARFWEKVTRHMRALMDPPRGALLPGVRELLDDLGTRPHTVRALLTGNVSSMAALKLETFGVHDRFAWGAFGDEAPDRDALACLAVELAHEWHGVPASRCIVVGDTEHDIACARAAGAHAVAVATGSRSQDELAGAKPDLLLADLTQTDVLWDWVRRLG